MPIFEYCYIKLKKNEYINKISIRDKSIAIDDDRTLRYSV